MKRKKKGISKSWKGSRRRKKRGKDLSKKPKSKLRLIMRTDLRNLN